MLVPEGWNLLRRRDIENAVSKRAKGYGRVTDGRLVRERDLQDADIIGHWCRDRRDQEQDGSDQEEKYTDPLSLVSLRL